MAYTPKFTFVGRTVLPKEDAKRPFIKRWKGGSSGNTDMIAINFSIGAGNSIVNVELFGMKRDPIYTRTTDNENIEVNWADRQDPEIINSIASYKKFFVNLESEDRENTTVFITEYDAIEYLAENLKNKEKICVTGNYEKEPYIDDKGAEKLVDRFHIQNVYKVADDAKERLDLKMDFYYSKDMVDISDFKSEKIITVDGFIRQYIRNSKGVNKAIGEAGKEFFISHRMVLNASKFDFDNEKHKEAVQFRTDMLKCASAKKLYHCVWKCTLINGAEEVEFDESQLTAAQKKSIELGLSKLEDYRPSKAITGDKKREFRLNTPELLGEFVDGVVEADYTLKELEEETIKFVESFDEVVETSKKAAKSEVPFDVDDDGEDLEDLFA